VNVEEGRHLWALVYLLHGYFGRDGREEAEAMLQRRSGNPDRPRILGAFNEPIQNWLDFYMFTMFTDRDGKYQLLALAESGFDPLARTTRFMLTEEAHHMFVGETGVGRVVERSAQLAREAPGGDVRKAGGIDLATIQKHLNFWFSVSLDLFGGEKSSNAADYFASSLKGREREERYPDHLALDGSYPMDLVVDGKVVTEQVPTRNAMNEILRDGTGRLRPRGAAVNKILDKYCLSEWLALRTALPPEHRAYAGAKFDPRPHDLRGRWNCAATSAAFRGGPQRQVDDAVIERGRSPTGWRRRQRINGQPFEFGTTTLEIPIVGV
jgi:benzoyl-CoA oxygenase B subunit